MNLVTITNSPSPALLTNTTWRKSSIIMNVTLKDKLNKVLRSKTCLLYTHARSWHSSPHPSLVGSHPRHPPLQTQHSHESVFLLPKTCHHVKKTVPYRTISQVMVPLGNHQWALPINFNLPTAYVRSTSVQSLLVSLKCPCLHTLLHALLQRQSSAKPSLVQTFLAWDRERKK